MTPKARSRPGVRRVLACLTAAAVGLLAAALVLRILWLRGPSGSAGTLRSADSGVTALDECLLGGRAGKRQRLFLFVGAHGRAIVAAAVWAACESPHVAQDAGMLTVHLSASLLTAAALLCICRHHIGAEQLEPAGRGAGCLG